MTLNETYFDKTGIVPAWCSHGLARHPDPLVQSSFALNKYVPLDEDGVPTRGSWIRSKYLDTQGRCVVCNGEERPDDLTEPAA